MSWAGKMTFAIIAIGAVTWHDVRTLRMSAPAPRILVEIEDGLFFAAPDAAWLIAPVGQLELLPAPSRYVEFTPLSTFERTILRLPPRAPPIFIDRFERLDEGRRWAVSDGWSNGAWTANDWRRRQLQTDADGLSIILAANRSNAEHPFASGEIATHEAFRYGYFEARFRMPRGSGLVAGVFTFTRPDGPASWHEIDMEILGRDTERLELTYFSAGRETKHIVQLPFDAADDFHTYAFEWRPDAIRWFVDDQMVHEARGADVEAMTAPQRFIVNLWNSEQLAPWVGPITAGEGPWTLSVACVAHAGEYPGQTLCDGA